MAIILLDESYYNEDVYYNNTSYFDELLDFISIYFDVDIALFIPSATIGDIWSKNNLISLINRKIQKTGKFQIFNSEDIEEQPDSNFDELYFSNTFIGEIHYLKEQIQYNTIIIPLSPNMHKKDIKQISNYVYIVNHIYEELDSNISTWISANMYMNNIINPTSIKPLPNIGLCKEYKKIQDKFICGESNFSKIPIFLKVGKEVLQRNTYLFDDNLSSINTNNNKIRKIYKYAKDEIIYGSIDVESGSIEICNNKGQHIDEFGFDNQSHNKHDSTGKHDIKLHK